MEDILKKRGDGEMDKHLNVARAPKDATFQVRINSEIKKTVEEIYARTGMTLTDAINTFIQQSINVEGLPFLVTQNSREALKEQALAKLMFDLKKAEERADKEGWIEAEDLEREFTIFFSREGFEHGSYGVVRVKATNEDEAKSKFYADKKDDKVDNALHQIKEKEYFMKFVKENETRKILAVAICYDSKTKEHRCKIEEIDIEQ